MIQTLMDFLAYLVGKLIDQLNHEIQVWNYIYSIVDILPIPSQTLSQSIASLASFIHIFFDYISFLAYFIDLRALFGSLILILTIESTLLPIRAYRFARSFLT